VDGSEVPPNVLGQPSKPFGIERPHPLPEARFRLDGEQADAAVDGALEVVRRRPAVR